MSETLSPFVFKKVSLKHLEIDKELTFKFRKATLVDNLKLVEEYGVGFLKEKLQNPINAMKTLFNFLSNESKEELHGIVFTEFDEKTGENVPSKLTLESKFLMCFPSAVEVQKDVYELFLYVFGYSKKQVDMLIGLVEKDKVEIEKKTQELGQKKR